MPSFEIILRLTLQLFGNRIQNLRYAPQYLERNFSSEGHYTVKRRNLRQVPGGRNHLLTRVESDQSFQCLAISNLRLRHRPERIRQLLDGRLDFQWCVGGKAHQEAGLRFIGSVQRR